MSVFDQLQDSSILERRFDIYEPVLSMEAAVLTDFFAMLKSFIPNAAAKLKSLKDNLLTTDKNSKVTYSNFSTDKRFKSIEQLAKREDITFFSIADNLVLVPQGFEGNLLHYFEVLDSISKTIYSDCEALLTEYRGVLSSFATDKEAKVTFKDHSVFYKKTNTRRDEILNKLKEFDSKKNPDRSVNKLDAVYANFNEYFQTAPYYDRLLLSYHSKILESIKTKVDEIYQVLEIIYSQLTNTSGDKVNKSAAMNLAEGAYAVAKYIEVVTIFRYCAEHALSSYIDITEKISKLK